jgi:TolA-binding protein
VPLACLLIAAPSASALAQMDSREAIALQNQVLELRRDVQALRDQIGRSGGPYPLAPPSTGGSFLGYGGRGAPAAGPPPSSDITTQLLDRVSALEEQVRSLRGQIDQIGNETRQQGQDFGKQIGDLNFRMQNRGGGRGGIPPAPGPSSDFAPSPAYAPPASSGSAGPPLAPPPEAPPVPSGPPPPRRPELSLQEGNAALARRDYASAESAAREVLANNRTSPRAYDAQFLLAESLAGKRDWSQAAIAFDDTYNRSRAGSHAQDSLIGLANSLVALGDKRAGCAALNKLRAEFPSPRPDLRDPIQAARQRAGCG